MEHVPRTLWCVTIRIADFAAPLLFALPWCVVPVLLRQRLRASPQLADEPIDPPASPPRVSIVLPARNEAVNIAACVRSICASTWPDLELIVVDDHSTDGTGALARAAAAGDARVRVIEAPDLPPGWFGKQWACHSGAQVATGTLLLFTDADTRHAPDLVTRMVRLRARRGAELLSVAGRQDMETVWECAVQPLVFVMLLARYGGASQLEQARHARAVVANGQCFMLSRTAYDALGGHAAVRAYVVEDVMMAQAVHAHGGRVSLGFGVAQLRTRMYEGLGPLVRGWRKNLYAGGRHAFGGGRVGQLLYPLVLLSFPLTVAGPVVVLLVALLVALLGGDAASWLAWSLIASTATFAAFAIANRANGDSAWRAVLAPLGGVVLLAICLQAIVRGDHVEWKGRAYTSA